MMFIVIIALGVAYVGLQRYAERRRLRDYAIMKRALSPKGEAVFTIVKGGKK
jgi:hypothetical protein